MHRSLSISWLARYWFFPKGINGKKYALNKITHKSGTPKSRNKIKLRHPCFPNGIDFCVNSAFLDTVENNKNGLDQEECGKRGWRYTMGNHRGSATMEAVWIMPLMLFTFLVFFSICQIYIVENQIHMALLNTAQDLGELVYIAEKVSEEQGIGEDILAYGVAAGVFREELGQETRIKQYVAGGVNGVVLLPGQIYDEEEGYVQLEAAYIVQIQAPFLKSLRMPMRVKVRHKAMNGYREGEITDEESQRYVYITEHGTVYHGTRECTHLRLSIQTVSSSELRANWGNLRPCSRCGEGESSIYYVTREGDCYHTNRQCSGLKRSVHRVRLKDIPGYRPCSRCGG